MNTVTLVHPNELAPGTPPERGPVGSIVPFLAFTNGAAYKAKTGDDAWRIRDGFVGRDFDPRVLMALAAGVIQPPERPLDMEVALDRAGIDRRAILFEIIQGEINLRPPAATAEFEDQQVASLDDVRTVEGYWVAHWPIQDAKQVSTDTLKLQRVL